MSSKLENIGYSDWFSSQADEKQLAHHDVARVIAVHKDSYILSNGVNEVFAELSGNLLYRTESVIEMPTVGDWVYADFFDDNTHAIIYGVFPRKTLLKRKTVGKVVDFQLIAANIDTAFIIQSLNDNFNLRRLERYLVMVNESGIIPIILLSKCDLYTSEEIDAIKDQVKGIAPEALIIAFSNLTQENISLVVDQLLVAHSYCLLGSSGVGKTTLLNSLLGSDQFETQTVSKIQSKGRHTTTSRQLVQLDSGAMIIDTPGMRELSGVSMDEGLSNTFSEIEALALQCKFANCSHSNEKGCAIVAAINADELSEDRFQNYLKMQRESDFNQMSYVDKRKKDKGFTKMTKSAIKNKNRY